MNIINLAKALFIVSLCTLTYILGYWGKTDLKTDNAVKTALIDEQSQLIDYLLSQEAIGLTVNYHFEVKGGGAFNKIQLNATASTLAQQTASITRQELLRTDSIKTSESRFRGF